MKFPRNILSALRCCAAICLAAGSVFAQSQPQLILLELKKCERELKVFEDGKVLESRDGKKTERQLSANRLRKLRQIIASDPCPTQFYSGDCHFQFIVSGMTPRALQELHVTHREGGYERSSTVYIACERPTARQKEWLKRNSHEYINPKRQPFLSELAGALGGKSILKGCKCSEDDDFIR